MDKENHKKEDVTKLCGLSTRAYDSLMTRGIIDINMPLIDALGAIAKYYKDGDDLKREKMALEREHIASKREYMTRLSNMSEVEDTMHPILRSEKLQKIRLDKAKEFEVWTKIKMSKEGSLTSFELTRLLSPFLQVIKNSLNQMATNDPALQPAIDKCLKSLSDFGEQMILSANADLEEWVKNQADNEGESELTDIDKILLGTKNESLY